jgi:hypothetical protein
MSYMIMFVIENEQQLSEILDAWDNLHVEDVTFVESTCSHHHPVRQRHIPMRFMFENLSGAQEACSLTLFCIVPDEATVQACIKAAESVVGDLDEAEGAMLVAWPLPIVKGAPQHHTPERR